MKKFLSMLLALSVVFPYTFGAAGSVFAKTAPTTDEVEMLNDALAYAQTQVNNNFEKAYEAAVKADVLTKGTAPAVKATKAAWDAVGVKALVDKYLNDEYLKQGKDFTAAGANYKELAGNMYSFVGAGVDTETALATFITNTYAKKAAVNQYKLDIAEFDKAIENVDYDAYSTNVNTTTKKTYLEEAKDAVDAIKVACKNVLKSGGVAYLTETTITADTYAAAKTAYNALTISSATGDKKLSEVMIGNTGVGTGKYLVNGVLTKTDEANQETTDKANAAAVKAAAQALYAKDVTKNPNNKDKDDAWLTVVNFLADATKLTKAPTGIEHADKCVNAVAAINGLNVYADKYKAEKDGNGNIVRDAADVDKIVKDTTIDVYTKALAGTAIVNEITDAEKAIAALTSEAAAKQFAFNQEKRIAAIKDAQEAVVKAETYYPLELEKYNAAVEAAIAKVKAAKIGDNLDNIKVDASEIATADKVKASFAEGSLATAFNAQVAAITNTINNVKNYGKTVLDPTYIVCSDVAVALKAYCGENGVRTAAEVKAVSVEAFIATLPTKGQIKDGKAAAESAIKAIPTTVKYADKAAVEAAYKAAQDYAKVMGKDAYTDTDITNKADLTVATEALYNAMVKDFAVKVYQVSKTDKTALKALKAEFDAANVDETRDNKIGSGMFATKDAFNDTAVDTALSAIRTNEKNAVKAAINALPINITAADKAAVEAARKAYDAYVAEYTDPASNDYAASDLADVLKALQTAEAALAEVAPAYGDTDAKASLLDMNRKVTIWRTSKKSIRVTAVGSVSEIKENGYTVKYTFYKKAPGAKAFKAVKTTTSNKYTYTNLKKGYNKFQVKVKVYDAEGKLVASKTTFYKAVKVK